jgi:hypothetical protein
MDTASQNGIGEYTLRSMSKVEMLDVLQARPAHLRDGEETIKRG